MNIFLIFSLFIPVALKTGECGVVPEPESEATPLDTPWHATLHKVNHYSDWATSFFCAATLIGEETLLTSKKNFSFNLFPF
jgi:hypothetical protein